MELTAFEVQVCAKSETRSLEMVFLVKSQRPTFLLFLDCFWANQMGFEQVFDNLIFKHMDALRNQIQSLVDYVLNHYFWTFAMLSKFYHNHKD